MLKLQLNKWIGDIVYALRVFVIHIALLCLTNSNQVQSLGKVL